METQSALIRRFYSEPLMQSIRIILNPECERFFGIPLSPLAFDDKNLPQHCEFALSPHKETQVLSFPTIKQESRLVLFLLAHKKEAAVLLFNNRLQNFQHQEVFLGTTT